MRGTLAAVVVGVALVGAAGCSGAPGPTQSSSGGVLSNGLQHGRCTLLMFLGSVGSPIPPTVGALRRARTWLRADPQVQRIRPLGRLGYVVTPIARADTLEISRTALEHFPADTGTRASCGPLIVGRGAPATSEGAVIRALTKQGLKPIKVSPPPGLPHTVTPSGSGTGIVGTIVPYGGRDGLLVAQVRGATYLGFPGERPFHVLVFSNAVQASTLPELNRNGLELDMIHGNVFVRDEGMTDRERKLVKAALLSLR